MWQPYFMLNRLFLGYNTYDFERYNFVVNDELLK